jgi:hypothetical protein
MIHYNCLFILLVIWTDNYERFLVRSAGSSKCFGSMRFIPVGRSYKELFHKRNNAFLIFLLFKS